MLYYFKCQKCTRTSGLFLHGELPSDEPSCDHCATSGGGKVDRLQTMAFFFGCKACAGQWVYSAPSTYSAEKATRPDCPKCGHNHDIFFVPVNASVTKVQKRQQPGWLDPETHDLTGSLDIEPSAAVTNLKRRKMEDGFQPGEPTFTTRPVENKRAQARFNTERAYREKKKQRQAYDKKHGTLKDASNPLKTTTHPGTVVSLARYKNILNNTEEINGVEYPRLSQSAPTVVNAAKLVSRDATWDYRELGPNSFLRRLCTLLYTIDYGGDKMNPVELQAMWAQGSLFISSNNYDFGLELHRSLGKYSTLRELVGEIAIGKGGTGELASSKRNFKKSHTERLPGYKAEFVTNTEAGYADYFQYQWQYIFKKLRDAMEFTQHQVLTITKNGDEYTDWTAPGVVSNRVYLVVPEQTRGTFTKKDVHAEQLFHPILMNLHGLSVLTKSNPAFVGGVKTPCRTCYEVMQAAAGTLGDTLVLSTDASGHYWEASARHLPSQTFPPTHQTMVFGKPGSEKIFDTEVPPSPKRD
jgi:hypothetical protein